MKDKSAIRQEILRRRKMLSSSQVKTLSEEICSRITELEVYKDASDICIYMPIRNEVDVTLLAADAWEAGKRVWLPVTEEETMRFRLYEENSVLAEGPFGIREPQSEVELVPDSGTLIIMPGAVFSEGRDRIGYGGGYYDRYLAGRSCRTLAAAYSFQVVESLPAEDHDIKPEIVVTDEKVYR